VLKLSPLGNEGYIPQTSITAVPLLLKVMPMNVEFLVPTVLIIDAVIFAVCSLMVIFKVDESEPPELFAQTVKEVFVMFTVGIPDIAPFEPNERPLGRAGEITQDATTPPLFEKVITVIDTFRVRTALFTEAVIPGAGSMMVMLMKSESEPPELFAQTE